MLDSVSDFFDFCFQLLLKTLNEVKESSASIDQSLVESGQIRRKLMLEYDQYRGVCENAAKFFNGINKIYKITVTVFTNLFLKSISHQDVSESKYKIEHFLNEWCNRLMEQKFLIPFI